MKMIAQSRFKVRAEDEQSVNPGAEFETDEANARDLVALGFARYAEQQPSRYGHRSSARRYGRRDMKVEDE